MKIPSELICCRIPAHIVGDWIAYCHSRRMSQSEAMRRAISCLIYNDESATNAELVVAATIEEAFPEHTFRNNGKYVRRPHRNLAAFQDLMENGASPSP